MLRVALTGGIGSGKSTVLQRWRDRGVPVIEADALVHGLFAAGTPVTAAVAGRFGPDVLTPEGAVDRPRLGAVVFADAQARRDLETVVHPAVYAAIADWLTRQADAGAAVAVAEIPLLFETGREGEFDRVVVAACDVAQQVARTVARGLSADEALRRVDAQWPIAEKVRRADLVIDTRGSIEATIADADRVLAALCDTEVGSVRG